MANQVSEQQFDYIVLGASTGLTTLNTKLIDSIAHTNGINLAMDDTALSSQYLMLQHFLAQGKTTKYCILAPSNPSFDSKTMDVSDNDYRFLPFISTSYVSDYYKQFESKRARLLSLSQWFPMLGVTYYNTELFYPSLLGVLQPEKRNRFDDRGNYTYPVIKNSSKIIQSQSNLRVDFTNQYVEKIKRLCEANNIKLICYFSPVKGVTVISENNEYRCINHSNLLTNTMYFYDSIHVNYRGRQISSIKFAEEFSRITNEK
ncbi:hypothetical protein [Psychroserpens sp. SPM9]|uniref:hypothetical protein n=1 Tax=Psychroserpens sp. SPM9 TaxID=2975598 RepID=UPI0021A95A05|nr:hypothetical protein [Psychroserpens sp. SPM9]MDG5492235.1 hypothetical protein [Psychroserpens sp. SPM9]